MIPKIREYHGLDLWVRSIVGGIMFIPAILALLIGCAVRMLVESFLVGWRLGNP